MTTFRSGLHHESARAGLFDWEECSVGRHRILLAGAVMVAISAALAGPAAAAGSAPVPPARLGSLQTAHSSSL